MKFEFHDLDLAKMDAVELKLKSKGWKRYCRFHMCPVLTRGKSVVVVCGNGKVVRHHLTPCI